jgi:hypothetical protein
LPRIQLRALISSLEEFVTPHLADTVRDGYHDDRGQLRALLRFGEGSSTSSSSRGPSGSSRRRAATFTRYFDADKLVIRGPERDPRARRYRSS